MKITVLLEERVAEWVKTRIGLEHMRPRERAMRLLEEALELAQAEGVTREQAERQSDHVYGRPAGEPDQEAAGVAVCLLGWCAARGYRLDSLALAEIERIEAKPLYLIRGSLVRKRDADLVTCVPSEDGGCKNCGSNNLTTRDDSDLSVGYRDPDRPWCNDCKNWAD